MNINIGEPVDADKRSLVIAQFAAPTSVLVTVQTQEVTPGQLIFLGHYLLEKGNDLMKRQEEDTRRKEEEIRLVQPPKGIVLPTK